MWLAKLADVLKGELHGKDIAFEGVSIDSRTINQGELFVAILGEQFDGHDYIGQAFKRGAVGAVVSKNVGDEEHSWIRVEDTRKALGDMAYYHRCQYDIPCIALTGSCGKTTVKEMLFRIMSQVGHTLATNGNFNNDIGVPLTLLRLNQRHQYAVLELAANHHGDISYTTQLVVPQIALITHIGPAHLAGFGSLEGVLKAKAEIFEGLSVDGIAIVNGDDVDAAQWAKHIGKRQIITFGVHSNAQFRGKILSRDKRGKVTFLLNSPVGEIDIRLSLPGSHHVYNALAAGAAACCLNVPLSMIKSGLEAVLPINGRLTCKSLATGAQVIDDTYNANPSSVSVALDYLAGCVGYQILVLGDIAELGEQAKQLHEQMGQEAKQSGINALYTIGSLSYYTHLAFGDNALHFEDKPSLILALQQRLKNDKTVNILVKGSRCSHMEEVVLALTGLKQ